MQPQPLQNPASPWHAGELAIQQSVGVVGRMDMPGRKFLRPFLLDQHREFYPLLHFVVLGSVDAQGDAWATVRAGEPGFLRSPDPSTLRVAAGRDAADPAEPGLADGHAVGLLGMDPMTRRRNRLNGTVRRKTGVDEAGAFDIGVVQSFGNCPRYIQNRSVRFVRRFNDAVSGKSGGANRGDKTRADVSESVDVIGGRYLGGDDTQCVRRAKLGFQFRSRVQHQYHRGRGRDGDCDAVSDPY